MNTPVPAYDETALSQRFDLSTNEGRLQSITWLADLYLSLVTTALRPALSLELGARRAEFSVAVKAALPDCQAHALEANPYVFQRFARDLQGTDVIYSNLALGERTGEAVFKVQRKKNGEDRSPIKGINSFRTRTGDYVYEDVPVAMTTVDDYVRANALSELPAVMWIDVEGYAFEVLTGATATLTQTDAVFIEVEDNERWIGQKTAPAIYAQLAGAGFTPVARDYQSVQQYNVLFLSPRGLHKAVAQLSATLGS